MTGSPIAQRLREAHEAAGRKNADVAAAIGVDVRLYMKWKAGTVTPSHPNLARLAAFFGKPVAWFFTEKAAA